MHDAKLVWVTPDAEALLPNSHEYPILKTKTTLSMKSLSAISLNTNIGAHLKWLLCAWKSTPHVPLLRRFYVTVALAFRSLVKGTPKLRCACTQLRRQDKRTGKIYRRYSVRAKDPFQDRINDLFDDSFDLYQDMLSAGVAKECARSVLPLSTETRLYMSGTIRSWLHYIDLRGDDSTQLEHRQIARSAGRILADKLPNVARAMWD